MCDESAGCLNSNRERLVFRQKLETLSEVQAGRQTACPLGSVIVVQLANLTTFRISRIARHPLRISRAIFISKCSRLAWVVLTACIVVHDDLAVAVVTGIVVAESCTLTVWLASGFGLRDSNDREALVN